MAKVISFILLPPRPMLTYLLPQKPIFTDKTEEKHMEGARKVHSIIHISLGKHSSLHSSSLEKLSKECLITDSFTLKTLFPELP